MGRSADGIMISWNKILLTKRSDYKENGARTWTIPWWWMEDWERPEQTVIREVKEETNLDFVPTKLFFERVENSNKAWYCYLWKFSWKIIIQEKEATDYDWFTYEETKKLKIYWEFRKIFDKLRKERYF